MKISLIANSLNFCNEDLLKAANKNGIEMNMVDFDRVNDFIDFDDWGDVVLWRSSNLNKENRHIIYEYLRNNNKIIINIGQIEGNISSKYYQQFKVLNYIKKHKHTSLSYIPTFKFNSLEDLKKCDSLILPIIEKPDEGSQGNGVGLINSYDEIVDLSKNIYQNFIPNNGDYRVICLGSRVIGIIKRIAKKGEVRNNISQGGSTFVETDIDINDKLSNIALQVSSIFNLNLCGVDIIFDAKDNNYKFLEVNSLVWWEGFSQITGINLGDEIIKHCIDLYNRKNLKVEELIQNYYDENFEYLNEKKFHYASRMYLFLKDKRYKKHLEDLRKTYIGENEDETDRIIKDKLHKSNNNNNLEYRNEIDLRDDVLKNYPNLRKYNIVLFMFLFSLKIYDRDISSNILKCIDIEALTEYYQELESNSANLCKLSTVAINYLYNLNHFLKHINVDKVTELNPEYFIKIAQREFKVNAELKNKYNLELYYYTHLIIGASKFYSEKIVEDKNEYVKMIKICEKIIQENYFDINIDNKVEFLVCTKLLDYETPLYEIIYSECKNSLSDIGNFLIDRHNKHININNKNSFIQAEHRNVLSIMAFRKNSVDTNY